ncbi:hypothetical protein CP10881SC42_0100 [Chlamydia avium]|uniref:Uncharacterized protein n=1 Tax=Chlamydia avium TaxID=1457141 RepID=A0ABN0MSZ2_9CHLA|nr:hypothetical protein CP10743SC13_0012 [Chlamydia psittaci 10_743_SC13]EPP38610.1 hypothetical protein CP10881SC42_0100 [Chlamydia avium]
MFPKYLKNREVGRVEEVLPSSIETHFCASLVGNSILCSSNSSHKLNPVPSEYLIEQEFSISVSISASASTYTGSTRASTLFSGERQPELAEIVMQLS